MSLSAGGSGSRKTGRITGSASDSSGGELDLEVSKISRAAHTREQQASRKQEQHAEWEKKADDFHLKQAHERSKIRINEGRAKPIDMLAKNLISEIKGTETAAGRAVFDIQALLPRARVVYCSATAVSEPRNYGYMTRLGLWGPRSPFPTVEVDGDE